MMLPPLDAWIISRRLAGEPINGELAVVSPEFKPLVERLEATPLEGRQNAFDCFLAGQSDRDDIVLALANVDPMGPAPPIGTVSSGSDWPALRLGALPPVDPFPVDVLPDQAARLVIEGANAIGCPRDFLGVPLLTVAGAGIGRSVSLLLKDGYFVGATAYMGCVGPPSDGKTPALKAVAAAIRAIDDRLAAQHTAAMDKWRADQLGPDGKPIKAKPPPPPKPERIEIDDATMEVIPIILADNPRGLIMIRDELTAFVLGLNQYKHGKGNDRSNALKIWSGDRIVKDRVGHEDKEPVRCPHPSMSIVGGLVPDMLGELTDLKGRADGFIDRFLLVYPDTLPVADWSDHGVPDDVADDWCSLVDRLWMRSLDFKNGQLVPHVAYFTSNGRARWEEHYNAHSAEMNDEAFDPSLRGPWGKLREYAGRLTLILTLLHHAADPLADPLTVPKISLVYVDDAWKLITYFKSHIRRIQAVIAGGPGTSGTRAVKAIVDWIRAGRLLTFTESEFKQARCWVEHEALAEALTYLTERNAIRLRHTTHAAPKGGRPPSPAYDVNPSLRGVTLNP